MEAAGVLVVAGEVHDEEHVLVVLVELRPLVVAGHVLEVELVEAERLRQPDAVDEAWLVDVQPPHRGAVDLLDPGLATRLLVGWELRMAA